MPLLLGHVRMTVEQRHMHMFGVISLRDTILLGSEKAPGLTTILRRGLIQDRKGFGHVDINPSHRMMYQRCLCTELAPSKVESRKYPHVNVDVHPP